jgi:phosphoribosyl 1,2-cyclic phosphodiesterase
MKVWVCGVRGSTPAPGGTFARFGGHTSCIALAHEGERPSMILDAGTGIREASDLFAASAGLFGDSPFEGSIVLSHLHWDHTQGLPFFAAGNRDGADVDLYAPAQGDTERVFERFMSPPHFPIGPRDLRGSWRFLALDAGESKIGGFSVLALEIPHLGGRTFGYRVTDGMATMAYLPDHCPTLLGAGPHGFGEYHQAALALTQDCDLVLHDGQYLDEELEARASFGHSCISYAVELSNLAGARSLMLVHHDPGRTDEQIDSLVERYRDSPVPVVAAAAGMHFELPRRDEEAVEPSKPTIRPSSVR